MVLACWRGLVHRRPTEDPGPCVRACRRCGWRGDYSWRLTVLVRPSAERTTADFGHCGGLCEPSQGDPRTTRRRNPLLATIRWGAGRCRWVEPCCCSWSWCSDRPGRCAAIAYCIRWIWTDTNAGFTLYDGYNRDATGASDQRFDRKHDGLPGHWMKWDARNISRNARPISSGVNPVPCA